MRGAEMTCQGCVKCGGQQESLKAGCEGSKGEPARFLESEVAEEPSGGILCRSNAQSEELTETSREDQAECGGIF